MVDWIKCVPFVGTGSSIFETYQAAREGNCKKALWKLGETAFGGFMDAVTIVTFGSSTLVTTSIKGVAKVVASSAVKNFAGATAARAVGTAITGNEAKKSDRTSNRGRESSKTRTPATNIGGGDAGPPRPPGRGSGESAHTQKLGYEDSPITKVITDLMGRIIKLHADIRHSHLRSGPRVGPGYSERVRKHVKTLDMAVGDQIGHIIGWCLGGPCHYIYNYFPQHQRSNTLLFHELEKKIQEFLKKNPTGNVDIRVNFYYDGSSRRPRGIDYYLCFYNEKNELDHFDDFHWYNDSRNELSRKHYRS